MLNPHLPLIIQSTLDTDGQILSITWDASPVNDMIADSVGNLTTIATFLCHKFGTCLFIPYGVCKLSLLYVYCMLYITYCTLYGYFDIYIYLHVRIYIYVTLLVHHTSSGVRFFGLGRR